MKQVTRALRPEDLPDLLERPPRATLAFVREGRIEAIPVLFRLLEGRHLVGVRPEDGPLPPKVKLLIDDGHWYFDLRGMWERGPVGRCEPPGDAEPGRDWYEMTIEKAVAWHYGRMHPR